MCDVYLFQPFQSAKQQAQRAGVPVQDAIAAVRQHQKRGNDGQQIAGKLRVLAWNRKHGLPMPDPTPPEAA